MTQHSDITHCRKDFPLLHKSSVSDNQYPLCYFDNAATALKPMVVLDALNEYYQEYSANVHRGTYSLSIRASQEYEHARETVRKFLDADDSYEIIFTSGTSDAINFIAIANEYIIRELKKPFSVSVSQLDHHSVYVPWQQVCKRTQVNFSANFLVIPVLTSNKNANELSGSLDLHMAKKHIADSNVLCISGMSNVMGNILPLDFLLSECQKKSAKRDRCKICIDGAQLLAHKKFSLKKTPVDAITFSGHKLCGPTGIGVLCIKKDWLEQFPNIRVGGGTVDVVSQQNTTFLAGAAGHEAGTPHIAGAIGMAKALEYLMDIGLDNIEKYEKTLRPALIDVIKCIPKCTIIGDENITDSAIVSFVNKSLHAQDITFILQQKNIFIRTGHLCAQPLLSRFGYKQVARVSCYFYNTLEELLHLKSAVQMLKEFL